MAHDSSMALTCRYDFWMHKYAIVKDGNGNRCVIRVFIKEAQANAIPCGKDTLTVSVKYKVLSHGRYLWLNEEDIYPTKSDALKALERETLTKDEG